MIETGVKRGLGTSVLAVRHDDVSWSGNVHFLFVMKYIFIIVFVTGLFTLSCVFSWCRLFLFMISPCSVFTKYDLGRWSFFFRIIPFLFYFSWNFILTLSFGFSIGNSPFFLLLFVCFFKYILFYVRDICSYYFLHHLLSRWWWFIRFFNYNQRVYLICRFLYGFYYF